MLVDGIMNLKATQTVFMTARALKFLRFHPPSLPV